MSKLILVRLTVFKRQKTYTDCIGLCCAMLSRFNHVQFFATLWTIAHKAPLSMGFSRQEYWSGLPCPPAGDLPDRDRS